MIRCPHCNSTESFTVVETIIGGVWLECDHCNQTFHQVARRKRAKKVPHSEYAVLVRGETKIKPEVEKIKAGERIKH